MRLLLLLPLLLFGCSQPCAFVCQDNSQCPPQDTLPGYYCQNNAVCLQDCYRCNGGVCVDTFHNCGVCGNACAAGQFCSRGQCVSSCAVGESNCSGSCYDLSSDRTNCGACGHGCAQNQTCANNVCTDTVCG